MVAQYRIGRSSMISMTNVSLPDAFAAVADPAPNLMRGLQIPDGAPRRRNVRPYDLHEGSTTQPRVPS